MGGDYYLPVLSPHNVCLSSPMSVLSNLLIPLSVSQCLPHACMGSVSQTSSKLGRGTKTSLFSIIQKVIQCRVEQCLHVECFNKHQNMNMM